MELIKLPVQQAAALDFNSYRIKIDDEIPANVYITKLNNINKFSKGNISAWTGKAKSKKTFAITMMVSSMLGGIDLYDKFNSYNKNKVVWIDTEQSPYDVHKVVKRLHKLVGTTANLYMFALRPLTPKERVVKIEEILASIPCDVLIIDGARDLIMNINNPDESTEIVTKLMKWSYDYNIHVSTVIHQSTEGKARGHIGTEIENKSETVIKVSRQEDDINVSEIEEVYGRGKGFDKFTFFIDDEGLPVIGEADFAGFVTEIDKEDVPF